MSATVPNYRWSTSEFVRAWEAGAFDSRVELVNGEVWPVVIGGWHGKAVMSLARLLPTAEVDVSSATLPSGSSLPDPDCWVSRRGAAPTGLVGTRVETWDPADVLLVVEISDEILMADLTTKARIYGAAGWPEYWVVSPEVVYVHTEPHPQGYRLRREFGPGEMLPVPYANIKIAVDELTGTIPGWLFDSFSRDRRPSSSTGTVDVGAVGDADDQDRARDVIKGEQHAVVAAAGRAESFELAAEGLAHPFRVVGQRAGEELHYRDGNPRRESV